MKSTNYKNLALAGITAAVLTACSSGGQCTTCNNNNGGNSNTGDLSKLTFTAPNIVPSLPTLVGQGYIVAMNNGDQSLNNLVYSVTEPIGGGGKITIDQNSAANCRVIPAHGECIFKVNVPAGTIAGSFVMNGNQDDGSILNRLLKGITQADVTPSTVIGIEQTPYTTVSGVDGIPIYYYSVVIAGTPYVVVSGAVTSSNAGSFNNIVLVDGDNNVLPNQQSISGNLGAGLTNLSQGSTFAILLPAPSGTNASQVIKIQSQEVSSTGTVSNVQTGTVNYNLSTTTNEGIVNLFPEAVYLTATNPEQIITFYNNGDAQAQLEKLIASNPNVEVIFTPSAIGGNGKSTATLKLKDTSVSATNGSIALTYNNSKGETTTTGKVDENVYPTPAPSPTPTPTPTPGPPPLTAALTTTFTPNDFNVTTANPTATRIVTLKNTGNTNETGMTFTFNPSSAFSVAAGPSPSPTPACTVDGSGMVTTTLLPNEECTVTVMYTSPNTSAGNHTATMDIAYTYNGGTAANTPQQTFNTNVAQSSANLASTADTTNTFGSVLNNNDATSIRYFELQNTGAVDATSLAFTNSNGLFTITTTGSPLTPVCNITGSGALAAGSICYYGIQFGPIPSSTAAGTENNTTTVAYSWSSGGATGNPSATQATSGTVQTATSAAIAVSGPTASGFANNSAPYQIEQGSSGTLTYTYTNTGSQPATNFYVTNSSLPGGWSRTGGSCATATGTPLNNSGGTCTVEFTINSNTVAANNFNQNVMTAYWTDQANPGGASQQASNSSTSVNVYQTPAVTAVMSSSSTGAPTITNPAENTDFYVVYTLTGGYSGQSFTYGVTLAGTPGSPAMSVYTPQTCTITSPATSCSIKIASGGAATNQSITYTPQGGAVTPTPSSSGSFNVVPPPMYIFVTSGSWDGALGGLSGADAKCNSDTAKNALTVPTGTVWKALLEGNNATISGLVYRNVAGATIATATGGNLVGGNTISAAINSTSTEVWTGENGTTNCTNWSVNNGSVYGDIGYSDYTNNIWWQGGSDACNKPQHLYCVQQPPTLTLSVANNAPQPGVDTANSCTTVTATLSPAATGATTVNFTIPSASATGYYFASAYGGTTASSTSCSVAANGTTCDGTLKLCAGSSAGGMTETVTGSATGYSDATVSVTAVAPCTHNCIFVTAATYNGNLGGFSGADAKCNADSNKPDTGTYKALLYNNNATTSGVDYYRSDNVTKIAQATDGNLVDLNSLINSISTVGDIVWTGYGGMYTCGAWTKDDSSFLGNRGQANASTDAYLNISSNGCDSSYHLYCVKQ